VLFPLARFQEGTCAPTSKPIKDRLYSESKESIRHELYFISDTTIEERLSLSTPVSEGRRSITLNPRSLASD
jgi:hypothetical protein